MPRRDPARVFTFRVREDYARLVLFRGGYCSNTDHAPDRDGPDRLSRA